MVVEPFQNPDRMDVLLPLPSRLQMDVLAQLLAGHPALGRMAMKLGWAPLATAAETVAVERLAGALNKLSTPAPHALFLLTLRWAGKHGGGTVRPTAAVGDLDAVLALLVKLGERDGSGKPHAGASNWRNAIEYLEAAAAPVREPDAEARVVDG